MQTQNAGGGANGDFRQVSCNGMQEKMFARLKSLNIPKSPEHPNPVSLFPLDPLMQLGVQHTEPILQRTWRTTEELETSSCTTVMETKTQRPRHSDLQAYCGYYITTDNSFSKNDKKSMKYCFMLLWLSPSKSRSEALARHLLLVPKLATWRKHVVVPPPISATSWWHTPRLEQHTNFLHVWKKI